MSRDLRQSMQIEFRVELLRAIVHHRHDLQRLWQTVHRLLHIRTDSVQ